MAKEEFADRGGYDKSDPKRKMYGNDYKRSAPAYYRVFVEGGPNEEPWNYSPNETPGPHGKAMKFYCFGLAYRHAKEAFYKYRKHTTVWLCDDVGDRFACGFGNKYRKGI